MKLVFTSFALLVSLSSFAGDWRSKYFEDPVIAGGWPEGCHTSPDKLVAVVKDKVIARHKDICHGQLFLPPLGSLNVRYLGKMTFECPYEGEPHVGDEVVGLVHWSPGMISRDGSRVTCTPYFELKGLVKPF